MQVEISPSIWARVLALLSAAAFVLCFFWGKLLSDPALQELHRNSLRIFLLDAGFVGNNFTTLLVGTLASAVWGMIGGLALGFCLKHCGDRRR
ncbi:hypothetical protein A3A67_01445 [Candidatus Peribacteria bacterium RIFCSPLOWO2_01_FULL_51_18]|nr:MAG: hypothetical protein A3C52_03035 [Candidatus Peribacteria bacterium RIFCSPHIGHO2_02_FULL_51_15]OGJ65369.1 MAG: hypothetical protein A3A67_01445 [Candidatus Peribacteria bacterium RIFCSPLOWO2_01_FULL_51_18]OGJ69595.1 MAG: hypothetical protein A3J34_00115 [Candidatus Peribacteria bacterium RIFCSPLOWO2_02_FULL_51_10]